MTEPNEPDEPVTEAAETVAGPGDKSTDSAELAWSLEIEETPTHDRRWRGPATSAALVTLLCLIVAVVTWFSITLYHQNGSRPPASAPSSSAAPAPKPAPPPPVTVTALPSPPPVTATAAPTPQPLNAALDQQFLNRVAAQDYTITDPTMAVSNAHRYCALRQQGISALQAEQMVETSWGNQVGIKNNRPSTLDDHTKTEIAWTTLTTEAVIVYACGTL